jgi:hypothetical protein
MIVRYGNILNFKAWVNSEETMKKFGYNKGSISKALEEALAAWTKTNEESLGR